MKQCTKCNVEKNLSEFYKHSRFCKICHKQRSMIWAKNNPDKVKQNRRKNKLKEKYNISIEEYDIMYAKQNGVCYICNKEHLRRPLNVDHCHVTGKIRKLLCDKCNMTLGLINDSIELLDKFKQYLKDYQ